MKRTLLMIIALASLVSVLMTTPLLAFEIVTQDMIEKEIVTETDLIKTADNFIILFDTSASANKMVPGKDISIIKAAKSQMQERMARLQREAHLLASVNHPNIAAIYNLEESEGTRWLVLELVEGRTLRTMLAQNIPMESLKELGTQAAKALAVAHAAGIIHRDIKPENVVVRDDGYVKVLDFGLARQGPAPVDANRTTASRLSY